MHARRLIVRGTLLAATFAAVLLIVGGMTPMPESAGKSVDQYTITGPRRHGNLAVFLIHGPDKLKAGRTYLTIQEALKQKIIVVHETGNVNELSVENVSGDQDVYIQSGDIVKGGRQDRTIAMDFVAPAHSGKMPIEAFCVEHGRWQARGAEPATQFASSDFALAGPELKLAARQKHEQAAVWQEVAQKQEKLAEVAGAKVAADLSPSSFELSLENKAVQDRSGEYVKSLESAIDDQPDAIGCAIAVNGKISSADVYGSHALFAKLWPKLLRSAAVEAMAAWRKDLKFEPATPEAVKASIADAQAGRSSAREVTRRVHEVSRESDGGVVFLTRDRDADDATIHENYVNKK